MTTTDPTPPFPEGFYDVYADDDDVIGLTVARSYPSGWTIVRTKPALMDAFDEYDVAQYLAWCLSNRAEILEYTDGGI